jgi:hypothetical protein
MKKLTFLFILFTAVIYSQTGNLRGSINDDEQALPSVNVYLLNTGYGTVSENDGSFEMMGLPAGNYSLRISAVGYETQTLQINIQPGKTLELNISLKEKIIEFGPVEVTSLKGQEQSDTRTSLIDLNPISAKILPGASEDVFRTLQSLPGVLAPNDFSSQLIVRGSGPDQNLIVMDDVEIFNPYRLYGLISMFNPDAVSDINLITGGFPAKYGDRLSAVLDVTNKEGNTKKAITGSVNASIVDANIVLEGKNPFNISGSWLFNSRRTYYDLIIEPFVKNAGLVEDDVTFPNFYDLQAKLVLIPFKGNKFLLNGIYSRDGVFVVSPDNRKTADSIGVSNVTKNDVLSFAWHLAPSANYLNKLILSWYKNSGVTDFDSEILDPSLNRDDFKEVLSDTLAPYLLYFKFNMDFSFRKYSIDDKFTYLWGKNIFEAGAGVDFMQTIIDFKFDLDPELTAIFSANPQFRAALSDIKNVNNYRKYRAYLQNNFNIDDKFFIQPSLRFDYYDILNKIYAAPRLSFSYALDHLTTLRAVWGIYYQSPGYEKIRDQNVLLNLNRNYTYALDAERAIHYVIGIERWLTNEWNFKVEGYYKDFNNLIVSKLLPGTRYVTEKIPGKDPKYVSGWTRSVTIPVDSLTQIPINNSYGKAYGIEFFLSKQNISDDKKLSGWVSYALAFADRFEDGNKYYFRFDQRHTVNVILNYKINHWLDVGLRWQYGSGFPISEPVGIKPRIILADENGDGIPESPAIVTRNRQTNTTAENEVVFDVDYGSNRLNAQKPAYHRLDLRLSALAYWWDLNWTIYLDIINVYNRANVIGYDYFVNEDLTLGRKPSNMFPIIPTFGFSVKF